jgi:hypothetical protein
VESGVILSNSPERGTVIEAGLRGLGYGG